MPSRRRSAAIRATAPMRSPVSPAKRPIPRGPPVRCRSSPPASHMCLRVPAEPAGTLLFPRARRRFRMETLQREHVHAVMRLAGEGMPLVNAPAPDLVIRESWARCVHEHHLDPTRMQEAIILPSHVLREHQQRLEELLHIARHGLEALYQQVAGLGYCVLLTDARGVTVDFLGDLQLDATLRHAGLYLGSDWNEQHAGTCGVGTAIATGQALTVHQGDHFDAAHIPLTCTAAPVY